MSKLFGFTADECPKDEDRNDGHQIKAGCCNYDVTMLYVLAETRETAKALLDSGAGICNSCMIDILCNDDYDILGKFTETEGS